MFFLPTVLEYRGYKFFFFSNEGSPLEPTHIHVRKEIRLAKFWLKPNVILANSWGMNAKELNMLQVLVEQHQKEFIKRWHDYFD